MRWARAWLRLATDSAVEAGALSLGVRPPGASAGRPHLLSEIAALAVTVTAVCDLAADLPGRELRRVHVRVGDARPDRFLHGREVAHVVALSGRPDHVGGGDRPANGAGRCGRARRLASSCTGDHRDAAVDVELADMD